MLTILLVLTAAFAILTWKDLHTGLLLLVAVLPSYLLRTEIFGIPTTLLELLVVTYFLIWSIKFFSSHRLQPATWRTLMPAATILPILLLLISSTISLFVAPDLVSALGVWKAYFVEPILLFFVVRYELNHNNLKTEKLFEALGATAIILSLVGIVQWLTGAGLPIPWDIERRVTSVFDYPNALGLFLGPVVIIAVVSWLEKKSWFWLTTAVLSLVAIVLAQSEAAIMSIFATLSLVGIFHAKTRYPTAVGILVVGLAVLLSPWRTAVVDKLTLQDYSGQVRLSQWSETIDLLQDHWLLGAGLSGYPTVFEPYHQATHLEIFQYPHNIVLNIWVELGLLGLVAFMLLVWQVFSTWRRLKPAATTISTVAFFALLQLFIHGLVDVPYFKNDLAFLTWILLAIVFAYARPSASATSSR